MVRFQQWQAQRAAAAKAADATRDVQAALMTQLAVDEADARTQAYAQILREEVAQRRQPSQPLQRQAVRASRQRNALVPTM